MTTAKDLRAQAERCRVVGSRYGAHGTPLHLLADRLDAQAFAIDRKSCTVKDPAT